jgi:hypothetical protein
MISPKVSAFSIGKAVGRLLSGLSINILDTYSVSDSGQLVLQNYASESYFSDDYVGFAQSF